MQAGLAAPPRALDLERALAGCARGDAEALRAIYGQEAPQMLGVARRLLARPALAEEVVHDAFLRIWQRAASFDPARGSARAWIYTILRNLALNALRQERRTDLVEDVASLDRASEEDGPEAIVARLSEAGRLRRCLDALDPVRREAIVLAYTRGLTQGELAGRFDVPLGTMKSWMRRGLISLRDCMA